jgi:glycosyltransferase involved in cell wall biosynthesis
MKKSNYSPYVVHLIPSLEVGGMERLVSDLAIARTSGKTSILCLNKLGTLGEQIEKDVDIEVLEIPKNLFLATWKVYKKFKILKPDIIHCHNLHAHFFGGICSILLPNTKVVLTKHGQHIPSSGYTSKINKLTLQKSKIIGVSADITQLMQKWITKNNQPIEYIANGVSLTPYEDLKLKETAKKELGIKQSTFCVGMVARLSPPKDHLLLIEAMALLSEVYPDIKLVIAGDGPLRNKIETYITSNHYDHVVTMLGERKDIANILNALDVFALTSSSEGIPMTILEAMAASLPIIATNVGGIPQVVINEVTGLLVKNQDKNGLVEAIKRLFESPELQKRLGEEGHLFLKNNYSINQVATKYENAYLNLEA